MAKSTTPRPVAPRKPRAPRAPATPTLVASRVPSDVADRRAIAIRAYQLFLENGGVHGRDVEHWLQAEAELVGGGMLNSAA